MSICFLCRPSSKDTLSSQMRWSTGIDSLFALDDLEVLHKARHIAAFTQTGCLPWLTSPVITCIYASSRGKKSRNYRVFKIKYSYFIVFSGSKK
jgi:hypothetical protein